jgi:DNA-binding response OmpR family regulator
VAVQYLAGEGKYAARDECPLPGLVLLDLNMPGKSGLEVLKWIRVHPSVCMLPVVVLTSSNQESDIHRAYINGANGYLVKPSKPDEMLVMARAIKDYWLGQNRTPARELPPATKELCGGPEGQ